MDMIEQSSSKPDHSLLCWNIDIPFSNNQEHASSQTESHSSPKVTLFDRSSVPQDFVVSKRDEIQQIIEKLERDVAAQDSINSVYSDFMLLVKREMKEQLRYKEVSIKYGGCNRKRRVKKPWWSEDLTRLWNELYEVEKRMLKAHGANRQRLRLQFKDNRKVFDKAVRQAKRCYWNRQQTEIERLCDYDQNEFWKKIGRIGIGQDITKSVPMEVIMDDGIVNRDPTVILERWKQSFSTLLNQRMNARTLHPGNEISNAISPSNDALLNSDITAEEVRYVMTKLKNNKAAGLDELPAEVFKTSELV